MKNIVIMASPAQKLKDLNTEWEPKIVQTEYKYWIKKEVKHE